ncbi:Gfo/Idh/MocA family protein, partial [Gemmatimonadota bacterium]
MADRRLGVGLIGAGFIGQFHIRSFVGVRDADITGIFDVDTQTAERAAVMARKLKVGEPTIHNSITELVADPAVDAVWINTPNFTRLEVMQEIVDAVTSGKGKLVGVCCEKPLGRNVAEARMMLELVGEADLLDGYLEDQLFSPSVQRAKTIVWVRGAALTGRPYLARS